MDHFTVPVTIASTFREKLLFLITGTKGGRRPELFQKINGRINLKSLHLCILTFFNSKQQQSLYFPQN